MKALYAIIFSLLIISSNSIVPTQSKKLNKIDIEDIGVFLIFFADEIGLLDRVTEIKNAIRDGEDIATDISKAFNKIIEEKDIKEKIKLIVLTITELYPEIEEFIKKYYKPVYNEIKEIIDSVIDYYKDKDILKELSINITVHIDDIFNEIKLLLQDIKETDYGNAGSHFGKIYKYVFNL